MLCLSPKATVTICNGGVQHEQKYPPPHGITPLRGRHAVLELYAEAMAIADHAVLYPFCICLAWAGAKSGITNNNERSVHMAKE